MRSIKKLTLRLDHSVPETPRSTNKEIDSYQEALKLFARQRGKATN